MGPPAPPVIDPCGLLIDPPIEEPLVDGPPVLTENQVIGYLIRLGDRMPSLTDLIAQMLADIEEWLDALNAALRRMYAQNLLLRAKVLEKAARTNRADSLTELALAECFGRMDDSLETGSVESGAMLATAFGVGVGSYTAKQLQLDKVQRLLRTAGVPQKWIYSVFTKKALDRICGVAATAGTTAAVLIELKRMSVKGLEDEYLSIAISSLSNALRLEREAARLKEKALETLLGVPKNRRVPAAGGKGGPG